MDSNLLEGVINVTIANPKWVRAVKGNKDDKKDSKWIADFFRTCLIKGSFIPAKDIREIREFTRYRMRLVSHRSSEKNRLQNTFTVGNIAIDSVVSDMSGVRSKKVRDYFDSRTNEEKGQELIESIEGYRFTGEQILRIQIIE